MRGLNKKHCLVVESRPKRTRLHTQKAPYAVVSKPETGLFWQQNKLFENIKDRGEDKRARVPGQEAKREACTGKGKAMGGGSELEAVETQQGAEWPPSGPMAPRLPHCTQEASRIANRRGFPPVKCGEAPQIIEQSTNRKGEKPRCNRQYREKCKEHML